LASIKAFTDGHQKIPAKPASVLSLRQNDFIITSAKEYIGEATNNQAEYKALIKAQI
jgi:ribonuclease HI